MDFELPLRHDAVTGRFVSEGVWIGVSEITENSRGVYAEFLAKWHSEERPSLEGSPMLRGEAPDGERIRRELLLATKRYEDTLEEFETEEVLKGERWNGKIWIATNSDGNALRWNLTQSYTLLEAKPAVC